MLHNVQPNQKHYIWKRCFVGKANMLLYMFFFTVNNLFHLKKMKLIRNKVLGKLCLLLMQSRKRKKKLSEKPHTEKKNRNKVPTTKPVIRWSLIIENYHFLFFHCGIHSSAQFICSLQLWVKIFVKLLLLFLIIIMHQLMCDTVKQEVDRKSQNQSWVKQRTERSFAT